MTQSRRTASGSPKSFRDSSKAMMTDSKSLSLRLASLSDLRTVNGLIERAIDTWGLPERVKRLCMPLYRYCEYDLECLELVVAEAEGSAIVGVAAWEQADPGDVPVGQIALLLHGIYVAPDQHRNGIGTRLFEAAEKAAASRGFDGVLVKAQPGAEHFFRARGLERLAVEDHRRDYPQRFWKPVKRG